MSTILEVFGWAEGLLLAGTLLAFLWGHFRHWELELLLPMAAAGFGTVFLAVAFVVTVAMHDHVRVGWR